MLRHGLSFTLDIPCVRSFIAAGIISSLVQVSLTPRVRNDDASRGYSVNRVCILLSQLFFMLRLFINHRRRLEKLARGDRTCLPEGKVRGNGGGRAFEEEIRSRLGRCSDTPSTKYLAITCDSSPQPMESRVD